jgi:hypothetical protein
MEKIIDIVHNVSGHTFDQLFDLIFTTHRLVIICIQNPSDVLHNYSLWEFLIGNWISKGKEKQEYNKIIDYYRSQEIVSSLNDLISANPLNREINYEDILSIKISRHLLRNQLKLKIAKLPSESITLTFTISKEQVPYVKELLNKALPNNFDKIVSG